MMTPTQIESRKKWILGNKKQKRIAGYPNVSLWLHNRGYHKGDIRCCRCKKWINPDNPFEAIEIRITSGGKRVHDPRYCTTQRGYGVAAFSTVSRTAKRRKRSGGREAFRY